MGLENSRDSFANLLDLKQAKEIRQEPRREGKLITGEWNSSGDGGGNFHASNKASSAGGGGYEQNDDGHLSWNSLSYEEFEPIDDSKEEEEHWPMWEMTGEDSWRDQGSTSSVPPAAAAAAGNRENEGNSADNNVGSIPSIAECERIFTVPEVYDEMQRQIAMDGGDGVGPCHTIFNCFNPWKQSPQFAIPDSSAFGAADGDFLGTASMQPSHIDNQERLNRKGAIKRSSMAVQLYFGMPASARQSFTPSMFKVSLDDNHDGRRGRPSIVGNNHRQIYVGNDDDNNKNLSTDSAQDNTISSEGVASKGKKRRIHFSELKQVLRMRKFTPEEAIDVWYQVRDFDIFKNEMSSLVQKDGASRQLAQAWLESRNKDGRGSQSSLQTSQEGKGTDQANPSSDGTSSITGDKAWWHEYNHSRRGLERYASPNQARQMLASYKVAVKKVMREQHRQSLLRCLCIPRARDPEKIAEVYHEYTAWSRDLALAAGASDADAVRTNFDDSKRHTREYYMLKQVVASGYKVHKHMPEFMLPKCIKPKGFLDEAESLFDGNKKSSTNLIESMINGGSKRQESTGEEARNEMSKLHSGDLEGPVSPALVVSLQAENNQGAVSPIPPLTDQKRKSMAEKAKNYPF
mmetsp:Transcript_7048/g.13131  ORF Transcript_7048/g.13131 Transcript_7048/m.13131 type:complete len:631 (-) Transcript_7048:169-2061(-)|eukprot:CAMPEP_0201664406 /NCGR_PEP_ID=MMETSP0494-20130426/5878_1 /ASSEMBLY_ACC=CAM_ASM_000839 /TAXON_ID=420259 /ORGANISM="Thalassiosira gravida, Strain GMp14c1" /LENGTH=630 /DNA_ID=CAMNT_0048143167 /DNA_START=57 /DNA_END=1949 /DNA_ORIENTATION=-